MIISDKIEIFDAVKEPQSPHIKTKEKVTTYIRLYGAPNKQSIIKKVNEKPKPQMFKWCSCHIHKSNKGIYIDETCYQDCECYN